MREAGALGSHPVKFGIDVIMKPLRALANRKNGLRCSKHAQAVLPHARGMAAAATRQRRNCASRQQLTRVYSELRADARPEELETEACAQPAGGAKQYLVIV